MFESSFISFSFLECALTISSLDGYHPISLLHVHAIRGVLSAASNEFGPVKSCESQE